MTDLLTSLGELTTFSFSMVADYFTVVKAEPILLIPFVAGIGIIVWGIVKRVTKGR